MHNWHKRMKIKTDSSLCPKTKTDQRLPPVLLKAQIIFPPVEHDMT